MLDPEAAAAFERAAALLQRDEHLDDDIPPPTVTAHASRRVGRGGPPQRQRRRAPTVAADVPAPDSGKPLPSLAELSQTPVLDLQRAASTGAPPRAGRRSPRCAETRRVVPERAHTTGGTFHRSATAQSGSTSAMKRGP